MLLYRFANQVSTTLGFDWLIMFVQPPVHVETVVRAIRMLVLLSSEKSLRNKFLSGMIFKIDRKTKIIVT